jgi:predicted Zn finger-like uncharacterized protein
MLIQCENCRTIFNLDEMLLKEGGSRVRCSRCMHLFMAYPPAPEEEEATKEAPAAPKPPKEEPADTLILMGDQEGPPSVLGKDEAFEAELESVYKDALVEPVLDVEKGDREASKQTKGREKTTEKEKERDLADGPIIDFLPMDSIEDDRAGHEDDIRPRQEIASKKKPSKSGLRAVLLALLLVVLAGAAAYLKPELVQPYLSFLKMPEKEKPADPGVRLLQFESVAGSFVDSEKGGQLFVIRGTVRNQYPKPRSHILIKGSILDNRGKVVESNVAYAGNTFTENELKTLPIEEVLKAMQNRDGMARQNFNVPSGAAIPFIIVFNKLPENLSEFAVEAVSSSPGT